MFHYPCRNLIVSSTMNFSYFSPLLKSVTGRTDVENTLTGEDLEQREDFLASLESRLLYLAADARSVLRLHFLTHENNVACHLTVVAVSEFSIIVTASL